MAALQIDVAHSVNSYFKLLPDYQVWRDCGGTIHWTAVHQEKVIEASCYVDDDKYELIADWFEEDDEDEEDIEHTDDESESEDEPESDEDDFIVDESEEPVQKKRKV
jgi:hypothetical protein